MPDFITRGAIVLLPKKADQKLLANKRPITLLNTCYKIGAKAFQRRLSPILQRIISYQQSAFLPGRNIHHSLLLIGEMLHQAHESGEEHILMKLDISKAFDRLEWDFIIAVVERTGLAGLLTKFLRSGFKTASSHIILNGRPTQAVRLARSVRQGCPYLPWCSSWPSTPSPMFFNMPWSGRQLWVCTSPSSVGGTCYRCLLTTSLYSLGLRCATLWKSNAS